MFLQSASKIILVMALQFWNAPCLLLPLPIVLTPAPNVTCVSFEHPVNTHLVKLLTFRQIKSPFNLLHPKNAADPKLVTLSGRKFTTFVNASHAPKAPELIVFNPSAGSTNSPRYAPASEVSTTFHESKSIPNSGFNLLIVYELPSASVTGFEKSSCEISVGNPITSFTVNKSPVTVALKVQVPSVT